MHRPSSHTPAEELLAPDIKIIISLREEYLGKLEEFNTSIPDLFRERLRLAPLTSEEAEQAIVEPAGLQGDKWRSAPFAFDDDCVKALIDFIDGTSDRARVIEPLTLQLVCQRAESLALERQKQNPDSPRLMMTFADFGGVSGLERLVRNYFTTELDKLRSGARKRAREMFERGLLDPEGKRLMLEQGEIERRYGLDATVTGTLVERSLLRREPRNESVFFEISHDRLAEAIAKDRRVRLPRWVYPTLAAAAALIVIAMSAAWWVYRLRQEAVAAKDRAETAIGVLLDEDLVGRLREAGLSDALKRVLDRADLDNESRDSLAVALKLRHEGDIEVERGTVRGARAMFTRALEHLDFIASTGNHDVTITAERARTLKRLAGLSVDTGEITKAEPLYVQSVEAWDAVSTPQPDWQLTLDAAETRIELANVRVRLGDRRGAEDELAKAAHLAQVPLTTLYTRPASDSSFELGRAMQVYADAALGLANVWADQPTSAAAHALAREAMRLRPLSFRSRIQLGTAAAMHGSVVNTTESATVVRELFDEASRHFADLTRFDPAHRRLQRERAALQVLIAEGQATCADTPACSKGLRPEMLEQSTIATLESAGTFLWLSGLDTQNRSLDADFAWALKTRGKLLSALRRDNDAVRVLDAAIARRRQAIVDGRDIEGTLDVAHTFHDKSRVLQKARRLEEALTALDDALRVIDGLPRDLTTVQFAAAINAEARIALLNQLKRATQANRLIAENEQRLNDMGMPWSERKARAVDAELEGIGLSQRAGTLVGAAAIAEHRRAVEKLEHAIEDYAFDGTLWRELRNVWERIAALAVTLDTAGVPAPTGASNATAQQTAKLTLAAERESALRAALAAAWIERVLSYDTEAADSWRTQYEARRSLAQFLRDESRSEEALRLVAQGVLEADEYARQRRDSADALFIVADANAGLGMLRSESNVPGWEEVISRGLAYGERLAQREKAVPERWRWIGEFRRYFGERLRAVQREQEADEQFRLARDACRQALRLSKPGGSDRDDAQACLDKLAGLGYR